MIQRRIPIFLTVLVLASFTLGMDCLMPKTTTGSFTLKNDDAVQYRILVGDNELCTIGLHGSLENNTQTYYEVDLGHDSFVCVDEQEPAYKVEPGKAYAIRNRQVVEVQPRP